MLVFLSPLLSQVQIPAETALVDATLEARFLRRKITRLIGDKGYDSDTLDAHLAARGIECIAPNCLGFVQLACVVILLRNS